MHGCKEGSEQARLKDTEYFEQLMQRSPEDSLDEYAREFLPSVRQRQLTVESYRFFAFMTERVGANKLPGIE